MKSNLKLPPNVSELRVLFDATDRAWYVGREYWDDHRKQWQPWGRVEQSRTISLADCWKERRRLICQGTSLDEGTAAGVYIDLMNARPDPSHRTAVFAALQVMEAVTTPVQGQQQVA